jgi:hypothetical protein
MLATLALAAVLNTAPAQLKLSNARVTHGVLGQERGNVQNFYPGDLYVVSFDIENLKTKADGMVQYSMGLEFTLKGAKKPAFRRSPQDLEVINVLGGSSVPSFAMANIGTDTPLGQYTFKVTVTDRLAKTTKTLTRVFNVVKPKLAFVRIGLTYETGQPAPYIAVPGQTLLVNFSLVGFALGGPNKQPNVSIEVRVYDKNDKPTVSKANKGEVKKVPKALQKIIPFDPIPIPCNRLGKFKVRMKVTDNISKKSVTETLTIIVIDPTRAAGTSRASSGRSSKR